MALLADSGTCVECKNCVNVCSRGAISIRHDWYGNPAPVVDTAKCVNCGLCERVCPQVAEHWKEFKNKVPDESYACIGPEALAKTCASGGVATMLGIEAINNGWKVVGAAFSDFPKLKHIIVDEVRNLEKLKGSKYVGSDLGGILKAIKNGLAQGEKYLFVGTPCQVLAAKLFLGGDHSQNILFVDLVCHGIPPAWIFEKYISGLEDRLGKRIVSYGFRGDKRYFKFPNFNNTFALSSDGDYNLIDGGLHWYMHLFCDCFGLSQTCASCKYASPGRCGDITLGDFYLLDARSGFKYDIGNGISMVLLNSARGRSFFGKVKDGFSVLESRTYKEAVKGNPLLEKPLNDFSPLPVLNKAVIVLLRYLPTRLCFRAFACFGRGVQKANRLISRFAWFSTRPRKALFIAVILAWPIGVFTKENRRI